MIHIINRHCNFSNISVNKQRPSWFSRYKCFQNLISTFHNATIHIVLDGDIKNHFLKGFNLSSFKIQELKLGSGALSFVHSIQYALSIAEENDLIYFVEDDYLHRPEAMNVLIEGMTINKNGYISLYDHKDKYFLPEYSNLTSQIYISDSCHWRTSPSTTDTFCITKKTLDKYKDIFIKWSTGVNCSMDHRRCIDLWNNNVPLITSIPGFATHCELEYISPAWDWSK